MSENYSILERINVLSELNEEIKRNINLLYVFKDYKNEVNYILITKEDKVHCFGCNHDGSLGFGHQNSVIEFIINKELSNKQLIDFKNNLFHTIGRTNDGKLYSWGFNRYLKNGIKEKNIRKPQLNEYLINENIIDMCCGISHTLVLTSNKDVYAWGGNYWGQIGNKSNETVLIPFKVSGFIEEKVKVIACGYSHSMALTDSGCVYSWGYNKSGQLGLNNDNEIENKPKLIRIEVKIKKISCGSRHSILLSRDGEIYVFGDNEFEQLGFFTNKKCLFTPIKLKHSEKFIEIATHSLENISAALSVNGFYYVWGECGKGIILSEPEKTEFISFNELFVHYLQITYKIESVSPYFSEFREIEVIAFGSFGIVCKAVNKKNDKIFAIKKVPINDCLKGKALKECEIMRKLKDSKRVVRLESFWIEKNYYYKTEELLEKLGSNHEILKLNNNLLLHIQMEFCYKTLKEIIEIVNKELNQKLSEMMSPLGYYISSELFIEILECVDYLHKQNIIHRDLKPSNILITYGTSNHFVKLADLGLATIHDFDGQSHTKLKGSLNYAAPELLRTAKYDTKADIFSLGIICQDLYNFDINGTIDENINLAMYYLNLFDLITRMSSLITLKRPNCEKILKEKNSWALSITELMQTYYKIENLKIKSIEESFHLFFIRTKLGSNIAK